MISFKYEGKNYTVPDSAYDNNRRIVLPSKTVLDFEMWLESMPPQPYGLTPSSRFVFPPEVPVEEIAKKVNGAIATEVPS